MAKDPTPAQMRYLHDAADIMCHHYYKRYDAWSKLRQLGNPPTKAMQLALRLLPHEDQYEIFAAILKFILAHAGRNTMYEVIDIAGRAIIMNRSGLCARFLQGTFEHDQAYLTVQANFATTLASNMQERATTVFLSSLEQLVLQISKTREPAMLWSIAGLLREYHPDQKLIRDMLHNAKEATEHAHAWQQFETVITFIEHGMCAEMI